MTNGDCVFVGAGRSALQSTGPVAAAEQRGQASRQKTRALIGAKNRVLGAGTRSRESVRVANLRLMSTLPRAPAKPRLDDLESVDPPVLTSDLVLTDRRLADAYWAATDTEFVELLRIDLQAGSLADSHWYRTQWTDLQLVGADVANAHLVESGLRRIRFADVRATGLSLAGCRVEDLTADNSLAEFANFRQSTLVRARFNGCRLAGADFSEAKLTDVAFDNCDLSAAILRAAELNRVTFRHCRLDGLTGVTALAGTRIATDDLIGLAGQLADALGITLLGPTED